MDFWARVVSTVVVLIRDSCRIGSVSFCSKTAWQNFPEVPALPQSLVLLFLKQFKTVVVLLILIF